MTAVLRATLISIRWFCRRAWRRRAIPCWARGPRFTRNRLPGAPAKQKSRAKSRLPRCESERQDDRPAAIHWVHAVPALADGCAGVDHARHRRCDGRIAGRLSPPGIDPSPGGDSDPDFGGHPVREPALEQRAALSCHDVPAGTLCRARVGSSVVYVALCRAAGRLVHFVRRALSDRPVRVTASFSHPSAQLDALRSVAEDAHVSRLSPVPRIRRPFWSHSVSHADRARRDAEPHGAVAGPRALTSSAEPFLLARCVAGRPLEECPCCCRVAVTWVRRLTLPATAFTEHEARVSGGMSHPGTHPRTPRAEIARIAPLSCAAGS